VLHAGRDTPLVQVDRVSLARPFPCGCQNCAIGLAMISAAKLRSTIHSRPPLGRKEE